tara:strand:- start:70 stop:768 length:699 start_codon:yes stop_codon:yes gene_type:complete
MEEYKEYKGTKVKFKKITNIKLKNVPEIFQSATYIGYCNSNDLPHGEGKLFPFYEDEDYSTEEDLEFSTPYFSCDGEWYEGNFIKGTYCDGIRKNVSNFEFRDEDWVLEGEGTIFYYGDSEENFKKDRPIAQENGIFEDNILIKGEILNPPGVDYSGNIDAEKIIYDGIETREIFNKELNDNIQLIRGEVFYKDGSHYKGEMYADIPFGKGTMKLPDGREWTTEWYDGEEKK